MNRIARARRRTLAAAALTVGALLVGAPQHAAAQPAPTSTRPTTTYPRLHCCFSIEASPTSDLTADSVVTVRLRAEDTAYLLDTTARLCSPSGTCATTAPDADADAVVTVSPPRGQGTFEFPFRIGVGTYRTSGAGGTGAFACGPGHPCVLEVNGGNQFGSVAIVRRFELRYAGTPHTTTTGPAHPWCALSARLPAWFWRVVVAVFGLRC